MKDKKEEKDEIRDLKKQKFFSAVLFIIHLWMFLVSVMLLINENWLAFQLVIFHTFSMIMIAFVFVSYFFSNKRN